MGIKDMIVSKFSNLDDSRSLGEITSDKASSILKELSGGKVSYKKKVIDNVIVFSGAAGGTGASTLVSNIAYLASKEFDMRVLVIDLNLLSPAIHLYFGAKQELEKPDLVGYLLGKNTLGEAIEQCRHAHLMFANNRGLMDYINCESDQAQANLRVALESLRGLYDLILIDCPMKVENLLCNNAFYNADKIYLVWDEGISCIANTEKIRRNMASTGIDSYSKLGVILNKRTSIQYNEYPFKKLNVELVGILPFEADIIYSSLCSEIFCDKGVSKSVNSSHFYNGLIDITEKILNAGGYVTNGSKSVTEVTD